MIILKGKAKLFGGKVIIQKLITVQTVAKLFLFLLFILLKNIKRVKKCDVTYVLGYDCLSDFCIDGFSETY